VFSAPPLDQSSCSELGNLAAGSGKSVLDVNWAYAATMANILVSGTLHKLVPRVWEPPAMLVRSQRSGL
jgi:hypothetical protein